MKKKLISLWAFYLLMALSQLKAQASVDAGFDRFICQGNCVVLNGNYIAGGSTSYSIAQIPYNPPPFCGGTPLLIADDIWSNVVNLPFSFTFYGITYNQCVISANGLVSFDITNANSPSYWSINQGIPGNPNILNCIACPYQDLTPTNISNIGYAVHGSAPNRVFQIYWNSMPMFSCPYSISTQAIVLYEGTNIIETYIQNKALCTIWNSGAAIHGIQDATGTQAYVVPGRNFPTQWTATNDAWRFIPSESSTTDLTWFANGVQVGIGNYLQVCPSVTTTYTLQGMSATGQLLSDDVTVDVTGISTFTVNTSQVNNSCFDAATATATVTPVGGTGTFDYQWSPISQNTSTVTGLESGIYTVFVSNSNDINCASEHLYNITSDGTEIIVCATTVTPVSCSNPNGGSATLSFSGGQGNLSFVWNTVPAQTTLTATGLSAGTYTITASDINSCTTTAQITLYAPPPAALNSIFILGHSLICPGETTVFNAANIHDVIGTFTWTGPNGYTAIGQNATVSDPGVYTVLFTDTLGCTTTASLQLTNYAPGTGPCIDCSLYNFSATPEQAVYTGSPIQLQATLTGSAVCNSYSVAPLTYAPIPVPTTATIITLGDNQVSSANPIGFTFNFYCADHMQFYISSNGFITFNGASDSGCCFGQSIPDPTDPNELIALAWADLNPDSSGIIRYFTTGIAPNRKLVVDYDNVPFFDGFGGTSSTTGGVSASGSISGQIILHEGSNLVDIITTKVDPSFNILTQGIENSDGLRAVAVPGRNATFWNSANDAWRFSPGAIYSWSPASGLSNTNIANPTASPTQATTYIVTVTLGPCTFTDTVVITTTPECTMTVSAQQTAEGCIGALSGEATAVATNGTAPYFYSWSNMQNNPISSGLAAGTITVTASDSAGCSATAIITITELPIPEVNAFINSQGITLDTIYSGGQATIFVVSADSNTVYTWSPIEFLNTSIGSSITTTPTNLGLITYTVVGESQSCTASDQVELFIMASQVRSTNAFTPNGDEINDIFFPALNGNIEIKSFKVFDRWGHTVHDNTEVGWDGTYKGEVLPYDSYIYMMIVRYPEHSADQIISGDVTLLR